LGSENEIRFIEVRWPSGLVELFRDVTVDTVMTAKEGTGEPVGAEVGGSTRPN